MDVQNAQLEARFGLEDEVAPSPSKVVVAAPEPAQLDALCAQQRRVLKASEERIASLVEELDQTKLKALKRLRSHAGGHHQGLEGARTWALGRIPVGSRSRRFAQQMLKLCSRALLSFHIECNDLRGRAHGDRISQGERTRSRDGQGRGLAWLCREWSARGQRRQRLAVARAEMIMPGSLPASRRGSAMEQSAPFSS